MESTNLLKMIQGCPFFANIQESDLQLLLHYGKLNIFSEGKVIYKIGEHSSMDMFFLILSGEIAIVTKNGQILQRLGPGELVSDLEVSLLMNGRVGAIQTTTPTEVFIWYTGVIKKHLPVFIRRLAQVA